MPGFGGSTQELALRRLVTKVLPLSPDIVTVYLGSRIPMKFEPGGQVEHPGVRILARGLDQLWLVKGMRKLALSSRLQTTRECPGHRSGQQDRTLPRVSPCSV